MAVKTINTEMLQKMFLAGAANLEAKKEIINELNVFPVPDGDTGTNMTLTIMSAAKEVKALENPNMLAIAKAISSGSLRGARGNSGVILSQLLRGFTKEIREHDEIDTSILARACERATATAYKAVMKPKEGTILTVAKGASQKAAELAETTDDLDTFISEVIAYAQEVLSKTPEMLPVLKEAGVAVSTARAGNVIGGGDFAPDRIIPDCVRAVAKGEKIAVRNPHSTRPYQHVLEPLGAYLMIAQAQYENPACVGSYNVGPGDEDCITTGQLADLFCNSWGGEAAWENLYQGGPHEANFLKLDCSRIRSTFGWKPHWQVKEAISQTVKWYQAWLDGDDMAAFTDRQIEEYLTQNR